MKQKLSKTPLLCSLLEGRDNSSNRSKEIWVPPKFTSSGLPLKGFLIRSRNWSKIIKNLDPESRYVLGDFSKNRLTYNQEMDKYLVKMWTKLHKYAQKGELRKFDRLAQLVSRNSKALRILAMCHVEPNWTIKFKYSKARWWYKGIRWMLSGWEPYFNYKRVWIPKSDGSQRPLAVPDLISRSVARIQYLFLQTFIHGSGKIPNHKMHGTTLGTGVGTAIRTVLNKMDSPFIYEFDVKKFFNSVNLYGLAKLWQYQFPDQLMLWLMTTIEMGRKSLPREIMESEKALEAELTQEHVQLYHVKMYRRIKSWKFLNWPIMKPLLTYLNTKLAITDFGLPQGYAPSPLMSSMAIRLLLQKYDIVMYVDDGIIFSDKEIDLDQLAEDLLESTNLTIAQSKSMWVKRNNVWEKPIEFLGLTIDQNGAIGSRKKPELTTNMLPYKRIPKNLDEPTMLIEWLKQNQKDLNKVIAWLFDPTLDSLKASKLGDGSGIHRDSLATREIDLKTFTRTVTKRSRTRMVSLASPYGGEIFIRDFVRPDVKK